MTLLKVLLSVLYGAITACRRWLYDRGVLASYRSFLPVISVGNITAGGNGKTPLCQLLVREARSHGYRPVVLSRGYGGRIRGPHRVSAYDTPEQVGDEPVLLMQAGIPVFVARSRVRGIRMIEALGEFDLVILDDGLQHRALHRDLDIVSIFAGSEGAIQDFLKGALLPAGMFRENRDHALQRASLVVLSHRRVLDTASVPNVDERLMRLMPRGGSVFSAYLEPKGVVSMMDRETLSPRSVCAFAGIAQPEGFFRSLETLGFSVKARFSFSDHHPFSEPEILSMLDRHPDLIFVCTAKDAVKLSQLPAAIQRRLAVLVVEAVVAPHETFWPSISEVLAKAGHRDVVG